MNVIIIGYGPGGVSAAVAAKTFNRDAEVSILTEEVYPAHRKPGSSLAIEYPETSDLHIEDCSPSSLKKKGIEVISSVTVTEIDTDSKKITYSLDGKEKQMNYDKLILATGGKPSVPKIEGFELSGVYTIQNMGDTSQIAQDMEGKNIFFIIGAGFSGLEVAEKLLELGNEVHLVVRSRVMRRLLEEEMSEELVARMPRTLTIHTGVSPAKLSGASSVERIVLNGMEYETDAVLFMTGVKPNVDLAKSIDVKIGELGGIVVNELMETSVSDIYAVGDCVEMKDSLTGKPQMMPIGSTAARAGRQAGVAAVGGTKNYDDKYIRFQYDRIFGTDIVCTGHSSVTAEKLGIKTKTYSIDDEAEYTKISLITDTSGKIIGGQVLAPRLGARIGYQIFERIESGANINERGLLESRHEQLKDLMERTFGPIQ